MAASVRAPVFLRAGVWPVSPLCTPALGRFTEWMPPRWCRRKELARRWLSARGAPDSVVWPRLRENFEPVMQQALHRYAPARLERILRCGSLLEQVGALPTGAVAGTAVTARRAIARGSKVDPRVHELLVAERMLANLVDDHGL